MPRRSSALSNQGNLFGLDAPSVPAPALPAGFAYRDDVVTPEEERYLIEHFEALPFKPFEFHGFLGKRRVVSFGWRYDFAGRALRDSEPVPPFLLPLRQKAAYFAGIPAESLEQILDQRIRPGCRDRLASRQADVPGRHRRFANGAVRVAAPVQAGCGMGARLARHPPTVRVSFARTGTARMGA
jgi:hypothetical protein